ncbi:MAG: hypothetical protein R2828_08685 [Saprospiraceae bacterium]
MAQHIEKHEKDLIQKYFGVPLEELRPETFKQRLKELRVKYHPDQFEKFEEATIQEMAKEQFQQIEALAAKIEPYLKGEMLNSSGSQTKMKRDFMSPEAVFASKKMKIEIKTSDKDLKYHLFGSFYRWLQYGDTFKIPNTGGTIIMDEDHRGSRIGFEEVVRIYLTFGEGDVIEEMVGWLFGKIEGRANSLIIGEELVKNEYEEIVESMKKQSFLRIGPATTG